ncbi:PhzF family isomerase [Pseudoduganella sp. UC29_106]|uniref:PhzF family isomerase n=1 Tax=Pseudoduganella sp. UC29_106 TaxID=3374553 RepID=UPI003757672B
MMLYHIDSFTRTPFRGNPAGVVLDADGLSDAQMQDIARELKHSETAFVLRPTAADHDVWVRFFTPTIEVPVCGHATIAAHYALAHARRLPPGSVTVQRTGAGLQRIRSVREGGDWRIEIEQGPISFGEPLDGAWRARAAAALRLAGGVSALDAARPLQVVSTGHSKVMVPLRDDYPLDSLAPDLPALASLSAELGCNGWFPFVISGPRRTDGRMFAPAIGIDEDPVTGNANGPLGAYLVRHKLMAHDGVSLAFEGHQGRALRREGVVHVRVDIAVGANGDAAPQRVTIAGDAAILFRAPFAVRAASPHAAADR